MVNARLVPAAPVWIVQLLLAAVTLVTLKIR